jgi:hypothetical protein
MFASWTLPYPASLSLPSEARAVIGADRRRAFLTATATGVSGATNEGAGPAAPIVRTMAQSLANPVNGLLPGGGYAVMLIGLWLMGARRNYFWSYLYLKSRLFTLK